MQNKKTLRLKLSDFINNRLESSIMEYLEFISADDNVRFQLKLWYYPNEINTNDIELFRTKYKLALDKLDAKIYCYSHHDFAWYDIVNVSDAKTLSGFTFRLEYDKLETLFNCLIVFKDFIKFSKKMKDTTNAENRNDRFEKVRESDKNKRVHFQIKKHV